jgi:tripartite-type tricarboxylate transporter receptor subunit TctC
MACDLQEDLRSSLFGAGFGAASRWKGLAALMTTACLAAALLIAPKVMQQAARAQSAQSAQAFYKGKVLTVIVPYGAAGGYEYWAAALKPYLEKALGVSRIDIVNRPGGGGLVGQDHLYAAKPDGLTIGEVNGGGSIFDQIVNKPGVNFDLTKFDWIGAPNVEDPLTAARSDSPYKNFADLWKLRGGANKVAVLSAGYGGSDYIGATLPLAEFGIPYKVLLAYQGSTAVKAGLLRGDGDIANYAYSTFLPLIKAHNVAPLFLTAPTPSPELPGLPTVLQLAQQYKLPASSVDTLNLFTRAASIGKDWAAPPGVPADRLALLRSAFQKAVENPALVATAKKAGRIAGYISAATLQQTFENIIKNKDKFTPFLKQAS